MKINDVVFEAAAMIPTPAAQPAAGAKPAPWEIPAIKQASASARAAPGAVAQAAPGAVKTGSTGFLTKKVLTPDQIKQYNAKQAAAKQAAATQPTQQQPAAAPATATQPAAAATQPAQQQPTTKAPSTLDKPYDPVTGKGWKYHGDTGETAPEWQKELDRQEASYLEKLEANRIASQAKAKEDDAYMAKIAQQAASRGPSNVTNNITQTNTAPNTSVTTTDPAEVKAAMQAKIDAMKQKNPKLAAQMAALGLDDAFNEKLAPAATPAQPAPVAEDVQRMIELAGLAK